MKKINMNRLAAGLLVLVLLTSCFVGSTMARYATGTSANDEARAAKFGVTISGYSDVFGEDYIKNGETNGDKALISGTANLTVSSKAVAEGNRDNVVAPGTKGENVLSFTIAGSPEVSVQVNASLGEFQSIKLPKKDGATYTDYTTHTMGTELNSVGSYGTFNPDEHYYPIVWTLKKGDTSVATGSLADIDEYLESAAFSKTYEANDASIAGTYTLSWEWPFGAENNNKADTILGMAAAAPQNDEFAGIVLEEIFNFSLSIVQVD